jgi:hypothetical protein
LSSFFSHFTK